MLTAALKPKACGNCGKTFMPRSSFHSVCQPYCLLKQINKQEREKKARAKADKAKDRATREKLKTIGVLIEEAQESFNAYIRLRDAGKPCICCGRPMELDVLGNPKVNAGHWRSRGAAGHLRFDETNCHAQRSSCNRPGGAKAGPFREGMIARVGLAEVERLESSNEVEKWDRDTLRQIKTIYRAKTRQLLKEKA